MEEIIETVGLYSNKPEEEKYWPKARGSSIRK
jgi:hypothetical protein